METELAVMACDLLTEEDLDVLRENIAIWKMYMERKQTDKILQFDKEFHRHFMKCATGTTGIRCWRAFRRILTARRC